MSNPTFQRIAIINRGEPAMRFIIAAREYEQERGDSLHTIALYTDPDRRAMFVREADEAYPLGPATYMTDTGVRKSSYLDYERLERALIETRAEAVWPGWGFVAERPEFVHSLLGSLCEERMRWWDIYLGEFGITDRVSYISTGGGAFLEFLEGKKLPAVDLVEQRAQG